MPLIRPYDIIIRILASIISLFLFKLIILPIDLKFCTHSSTQWHTTHHMGTLILVEFYPWGASSRLLVRGPRRILRVHVVLLLSWDYLGYDGLGILFLTDSKQSSLALYVFF